LILNFYGIEWETVDPWTTKHAVAIRDNLQYMKEYFFLDRDREFYLEKIRSLCEELLIPETAHFNFSNPTLMFQYLETWIGESTTAQRQSYLDLRDYLILYEKADFEQPLHWGFKGGSKRFRLRDEDYFKFTLQRNFGDMFLSYPHLEGRSFEQIVATGNFNIDQSLLVPQYWTSTDFEVHLDDPITEEDAEHLKEHYKAFYQKMPDKLPYNFHDPRMALGEIKIATLKTEIDKEELLKVFKNIREKKL